MTVQELINELQKVEDKSKPVYVYQREAGHLEEWLTHDVLTKKDRVVIDSTGVYGMYLDGEYIEGVARPKE
jgi:hypothetical protein